jgi:hypothetical protein
MTSANVAARASRRRQILAPYRADPDSPSSRGARRFAIGSLCAFSVFWGLVFAFFAPALIAILIAPVGVLLLAVFWALPDQGAAPIRPMGKFFFVFTAILIVWPFYLTISIPHSGLPWISLQRLTSVPMAILLLSCLAVSKGFRSELAQILRAERPIAALMIGFVIIQSYSIILSNKPFVSLNKWLDTQIACSSMFFAACYLFSRPRNVTRWAAVIWSAAIFTGLVGVWEWHHHALPWSGHLPGFLQLDPEVAAEIAPGFRNYSTVYRTQSTFQSALGLGEYMSLTLPFLLCFVSGPFKSSVRILAMLSIPFVCFVVFISNARSGMIGLLIDFALYGFYWGFKRWRRRPDSLIAPAVTLSYPVVAAAALASTFLIGRIHRAVWGGGETESSTLARKVQYSMGIPKILSHPLGHGIGRAAETLGFYQPNGLLTIDTYYLAIALDYGILGFIAFYGLVLYASFTAGVSTLKDDDQDQDMAFLPAAGVALASFFVIKSVYSEIDNHPLYFMVLGMVPALIWRLKKRAAAVKAQSPDQSDPSHMATSVGPRRPRSPAHQPARA